MNILKSFVLSVLIFVGLFYLNTNSAEAEKSIQVNLTTQRLQAMEDGAIIYDFPISSGKIYPTPTGSFWPWIKLRYDTMSGGSRANGTYYNLPNVPYVMYIYNDAYPKWRGYAIHGTYWHNNFGTPMSHGCINLRTSDAEKLFYWTETLSVDSQGNGSGTPIHIFGQAPI